MSANNTNKKTAKDFKFLRIIGEGTFSSVYLAIDSTCNPKTPNARKYAIKVCEKCFIKRNGMVASIMNEKHVMNLLNNHPSRYFTKLYYTFHNSTHLFFVMSYADNGELLKLMQKDILPIDQTRRFSLEIVEALEHLHRLGIVHRDLKPQNILLSASMSILITDFGSASLPGDKKSSFVGTAQYVSPEMLVSKLTTNMSDIWALGVIVYQMLAGEMPFDAPSEYIIYKKIQSLEYEMPEEMDGNAKNLISSILKIRPEERLGASDDLRNMGYISLREHPFLQVDPTLSERLVPIKTESEDITQLDDVRPGYDEARQLEILIN